MWGEFAYWQVTGVLLTPAVLLAAWIDWRHHRVPNWLTATTAAVGLGVQTLFFGWPGLGMGLAGLATGFALLIVPWLMHGMGAGDVKLLAAIGAWFGPLLTLVSFCVGAVLGGAIAAVMILVAHKGREAMANLCAISYKMTHRDVAFTEFASAKGFGPTSQLLPYGVPLTIGALAMLACRIAGVWPVD